jgi:hypothetical protein
VKDCSEFRDIIADLARSAARGEVVDESAVAHATLCEPCAAMWAAERQLAASLDVLRMEDQARQAPARLERALLEEFRALHRPLPAARAQSRQPRWWAMAAAVAAAAMLAAWLGARRQQAPPAGGAITLVMPQEAARRSPTQPAVPPPSTVSDRPPASPKPPVERPSASPKPRPQVAGPARASENTPATVVADAAAPAPKQEELVTDFVPLTYSAWTPAVSEATLVRVRLPSTALLYFGLPGGAATTPVEAEFVFGEDGLAHAVRFVRPVLAATTSAGESSRTPRRY